jgi:hypothetical protein
MHAGRYHEQLLRFYDRLGPEQVLVLWFEDLARDSDAVVREALSFLGLAPNNSTGTDEAHNTTTLPRSQMLNRLRRSQLIRRVAHAFPDTIRVLFRKVYQRLNMAERPSLDPNVRAELTARLAPDIKRLQRLLDEDLSHWIE